MNFQVINKMRPDLLYLWHSKSRVQFQCPDLTGYSKIPPVIILSAQKSDHFLVLIQPFLIKATVLTNKVVAFYIFLNIKSDLTIDLL